MSSDVLEVMKRMAWNRAKGELQNMLETYHSEPDRKTGVHDTADFDAMRARVLSFIEEVDDNL